MTDETPELERWALLAKYVAGECSPADRARVDRWLAADPARRLKLDEVRMAVVEGAELIEPIDPEREQRDSDIEWRRLAGAIGVRRRPARTFAVPRGAGGRRWIVGSLASVGALAAAIVVGMFVVRGRASSTQVAGALGARQYVAVPGERETVTLSDGTQFSLAPGSRVSVPMGYGQRSREVSVEGEAYFTVVHDATRPFRVRAGNAVATDVGTRFDVRAYGVGSPVIVAVAEGAVALASGAHGGSGVALRGGDVAVVDGTGEIQRRVGADLEPYVGWTRGELVFEDEPLGDVVQTLGRWYGVRIVLADSALARRPIRATYTTQSMTDVLALVTGAVGAHYRREASSGTITVERDR